MTAGLAQMVEQRFCKAKVAGSIPAAGAVALMLAMTLGGCASSGNGEPNAASAARGEAFAQNACSSCHAMGLEGASPMAGAIAFRDMRMDVNAVAYQRRMAQMHLGRSTMPPAQVSLEDIRDIDAYARSLRGSRDR